LLGATFLLTRCAPAPEAERGARQIARYGCGTCHTIGGIAGAHGLVGPPLDSLPSRMYIAGVLPNNTTNFVRWVQDPKAVDEKTANAGSRRYRIRRQPYRSVHLFETLKERESIMITLADARRVIAAAEAKAKEIGQPMNIAVVDSGGNLVAHVRMDKAWIGSVDISINKAWTARAFDISTKDLAENSQSGDQFFGIHVSNHGRVMIFAGGIPLKRGEEVVGGIGVSGGLGKQDQAVAEAGAAAF
jgi:uncharacterized protein GlcG (DUF336 family)